MSLYTEVLQPLIFGLCLHVPEAFRVLFAAYFHLIPELLDVGQVAVLNIALHFDPQTKVLPAQKRVLSHSRQGFGYCW
jgi:hypothetical protein